MTHDTRKLRDQHSALKQNEQLSGQATGSTKLPTALRFGIADTSHTVTVPVRQAITIGRHDPAQGLRPDVDLAPYQGYQLGVSRRHAIILINNNALHVRSLNTTNGTAINGRQLMPGLEYPLHDGDELTIGALPLNIEMITDPATV